MSAAADRQFVLSHYPTAELWYDTDQEEWVRWWVRVNNGTGWRLIAGGRTQADAWKECADEIRERRLAAGAPTTHTEART